VIAGIAVALGVLWFVHRLISIHGGDPLAGLEAIAVSLVIVMIVLKHLGVIANEVVHPGPTITFEVENRDLGILFFSVFASFAMYVAAKKLLK
jgi:hypothetical protein